MRNQKWLTGCLLIVLSLILIEPSLAAAKKKKEAGPKPTRPSIAAPLRKKVPAAVEKVMPEPSFFGEVGWGGGGLVAGVGYGNNWTDLLRYSGRIGYGLGNGYSLVVLDVGQLSYNMRTYFLGLGLNYVMYSGLVAEIPGLFSQIPSKNLFGLEMVIGRRFGNMTGRLGYSTALGLRLSADYGF